MVVLGIDPGTRRCGYGVVALRGGALARLASGVIEPGRGPMAERLAAVHAALSALLASTPCDLVAVESAFCGRSPRSALALGQARGVALAAAAAAGLAVVELSPAEVKRAFAGHGRAEKSQMVHMARALFGLEPRRADEADALAVAVCCLARQRGVVRPPRGAEAGLAAARAAALRPAVRRYGVSS